MPIELEQRQSLPLDQKIALSKRRIKEWYDHFDGDVYLSFSGGKDSSVLFDLIQNIPDINDIEVVFCDTGLEYPEVREHALKNATIVIRPDMTFKKVIDQYGYPFPSKEQAQYIRQYRTAKSEKTKLYRWNGDKIGRFKISEKWKFLTEAPFKVSDQCCDVMKKRPFKKFEKESGLKPILATMAEESSLRSQLYRKYGCNAFDLTRPRSTPIGFWTEQDILRYIQEHKIEIPSVYGEIVTDDLFEEHLVLTGCDRTGCMFCLFGIHKDQAPNRFQRMKETHPKQYRYCMKELGVEAVLDYLGVAI